MRYLLVPLFLVIMIFVSSPGNSEPAETQVSGAKKDDPELRMSVRTGMLPAQARLLNELNIALLHGSISGKQAFNLRQEFDGLVEREDGYLRAGNPIPLAVLRQETRDLDGIQAQLQRFAQSAPVHEFKGSAVLQDQVRSEVDQCLKQGEISVHQASDLRKKLNGICAEEAWYLDIGGSSTIPEKVIDEDTMELNDLDGQLKRSMIVGKTDRAL
jgi:hypothetical protein